jgi:hypothetical protein
MKVSVNELLEATHSEELEQVSKLQDEIKQLEEYIKSNEDSEDGKVLLNVQISQNKLKRLNYELEKLQSEITEATKEAQDFWKACNLKEYAQPKIARIEKALEALKELNSEDVAQLQMFQDSLERNIREARGKLAPWMQLKDTAPSQWVKLVS